MVQHVLRGGLVLAMVLLAVGLGISIARGQGELHTIGLWHLLDGNIALGDRLMAIGVLVLACTPAFRVAALLLGWIQERDWRFVAVAATVVVTLIIAIIAG